MYITIDAILSWVRAIAGILNLQLLAEKRQGYQYEHCFSYDWNAMKGYHYLMRIGRTINVLAQYSESLVWIFIEKGVRGFISFVREALTGPGWILTGLRHGRKMPFCNKFD